MKTKNKTNMGRLKVFKAIPLAILIYLTLVCPIYGEVWTNEEIVKAIWIIEGKEKAVKPYGIMLKGCTKERKADCRRYCYNTVRNNRKRYKDYGNRDHKEYISFLASRYAPTQGDNLTSSERNLNVNWLPNLRYWLKKNRRLSVQER